MATTTHFVARSVTSTSDLNWVFLADWIIVLLTCILFLFYFHRIIGTGFNWILSPIIWRKFKVRITVQALKLSLLSGRIIFKNVTIITKNEMIVIYQGTLSWRYWYRQTRVNQLTAELQNINQTINQNLPARLTLEISGLEVFIYNRMDAYDIIEQKLKAEAVSTSSSGDEPFSYKDSFSEASLRNRKNNYHTNLKTDNIPKQPSSISFENVDDDVPLSVQSYLLMMLPLEIKVNKGSIIIGNDTVPYIFVGYYKELKSIMDGSNSNSEFDPYRILHDIKFQDLKVELKKNVSFDKNCTMNSKSMNEAKKKSRLLSKIKNIRKVFNSPFNRQHVNLEKNVDINELNPHWRGLTRYMQEFQSLDSFEWESLYEQKILGRAEYAKESVVLIASSANIMYYHDILGIVPENPEPCDSGPDIGNGGTPPKFGVDVYFSGMRLTFGPWSNKKLNEVQKMLFPILKSDSKLSNKLIAGQLRNYVAFDLQVQLLDETLIKVPFREESKEVKTSENADLRYGWIDINIKAGSSLDAIAYSMPTDSSGFKNNFSATLIKPEISSSVNGALLFKADKHTITGDIGYPLQWRGLTKWNFTNTSYSCDIYLLREHVTAISDLIGDFGSGEVPSCDSFRPFIYKINWDMKNYSLYLNVNEENIIDNPIDHDRNRFISFCGDDLILDLKIPMIHQFQKSNAVDFRLETSYFILSIDHQEWSTYSEFNESNEVGYAADFTVNGSYTYYNVIEHGAVDTIIMDCRCKDTTVKAYGFLIKYFMDLKENYFGNLIRFKTYEEYTHNKNLERLNDDIQKIGTSTTGVVDGVPVQTLESIERKRYDSFSRPKNETDLQMTFCVDNGCLVFPCNLYNSRSHVALHFDDLDIDLRNTNYYMDLQGNFSEIKGRYIEDSDESIIFTNTKGSLDFKPDIYIDQLSIHGLRIFGLPPVEPTYYCRWSFDTDGIIIDSEPNIIGALNNALNSFSMGHSDLENSLGIIIIPVMDILNLDFKTPYIKVKINSPVIDTSPDKMQYSFELELIKLSLSISDQPTTQYNSATEVIIEEIKSKAMLEGKQIFDLSTNLKFTNLCQKKNAFHRMLQQSLHLHDNDGPFHRTPWLIPEFQRDRMYQSQYGKVISSIYLPKIPIPLNSQTAENYINSLPDLVKAKFLDSNGGISRLPSAVSEKFNFSILSLDQDDDYYARDIHQPTDSLEYYNSLADLDPECEHDNVTVEMDQILIFLFPGLVIVVLDILSKINDVSMSKVLDKLQVEYYMKMKAKIQKTLLNLNFHCDLIDIFIASEIGDNNGISLRCHNTDTKLQRKTRGAADEKVSLKHNMDKLDFTIYNNRKTMVSLEVFNFSLEHLSTDKKTTYINLTDFEIDVKLSYTNWVVDYVSGLLKFQKLMEVKNLELKRNQKKAKIELLYQLTIISIENSISADPQCLSAIWNQSKKDSVRRDKNWRMLPRLRHILNSVPLEWLDSKNNSFKHSFWEAPLDADERLQNIFANIRVWEKRQDDIIEMVFGNDQKQKIHTFHTVSLDMHHFQINLSPFDRAVQITDMKFNLREDYLDPEISNIAYPLLDTDIESSLDINFDIKQFLTNFMDIKLNAGEVQQAVESIIQVTNSFKDDTVEENDSAKSMKDFYIDDEKKPLLITFNTNIDYFKHLFEIDKSQLSVQGTNSKLFSSMIKTDRLLSFSLNFINSYLNIALDVDSFNTLEYQMKNFSTNVVNTKPFDDGDLVFIVENEDAEFYLGCEEDGLIPLLDTLVFNEYPSIKEIFDHLVQEKKLPLEVSSSAISSISTTSFMNSNKMTDFDFSIFQENIFTKLGIKASVIFNFNNFTSEINLFHPLVHKLHFNQVHFKLESNESGLASYFTVNRSTMDIMLFNIKYLSVFFRSFDLNCDVKFIESIYMFDINGFLSESRFNMNHKDMIDLIYVLNKNWENSKDRIQRLTEKINEIRNHFMDDDKSIVNNDNDNDNTSVLINTVKKFTRFKIGYHLNKLTTWAVINGNTVQLESNNFGFELISFDEHLKRHLIHGQFLLPSVKLNVMLNGAQGSSFNMLDVQLRVSIKNPDEHIYLRQKLHITSDYFRLVVKNQLIYEFIHAYGHINEILNIQMPSSALETEVNNLETLDTISRFFAIVIEANNVCFGWLLDVDDCHPGPIIGFEKTIIISNEGSGDVSMKGLYCSVANGPTPDTYFPTKNEFTSNNRIYIPGFDLIYTLTREDDTFIFDSKLTGDRVDLKLQTEFFEIGQPIIMAFSSIEEQLSQIGGHSTRKISEKFIESKSLITREKKKVKKQVKNNFNIELHFAGASVLIENQYFIENEQHASLELKAPTLDVIIGYTHDSFALKKYGLVIEAQIGETENKLFCTCVPVIIDIVKSMQRYMRSKNTQSKQVINSQTSTTSIDIVSLSEKIDFNFDLKIDPQKLVLNCDPRAQIEAEVSLEGIGFHLTTEHDFLSGVIVINRLSAELKHAFSKVISGSVGLDGFILNSILAPIKGVKEVTTVGSVEDVNGYINIQQLQDLDVFKDLWFPKELYDSNLEKITKFKVGNKRTFGQIIRDVTTGSPLPWSIIFYINNIQGMIDLGVSLGSLNLTVANFKAHSRRSHNWDHCLDLKLDSTSLSSHGKIEGLLKTEGILFQTSISFKEEGEILDIPLVSVGFGVDTLQSNISIDYHPFFIINGRLLEVKVLNENGIRDKLTGSFKVGSFKVYTTAMMASNFVEIYSIGLRISQNIKISYRQTLNISGNGQNCDPLDEENEESIAASMTFLKMVSELQTRIFIDIGNFETFIFPSSLLDSQALLFKTGSVNAYFLQDGIRNELSFRLSDVFISLSTFNNKIDLNNLEELRTNDDSIFVFPNLKISMMTKTEEDNIIKYTYGCQFGDKVDIKWKIGSVYFIHQMWISHATTLKERLSFLRIHSESKNEEENYKESLIESINFEDKLKDLEMDDEFKYEWIEPPIIETPKLKDLGEATPPLEWFGFHRDKFPILTHKFVILGLKELLKEVEIRYSKVLK